MGDSGYLLQPGFLTPYGRERYHPNQCDGANPPSSYKKCLTNDIICYDMLLNIFLVCRMENGMDDLKENPTYNINIQRRVIAAIMALHNFIRLSNLGDVDFDSDYPAGNVPTEDSDSDEDEEHNNTHVYYMEGSRD